MHLQEKEERGGRMEIKDRSGRRVVGKKRKMEKQEEEQAQDRQDNDPIPSSEERWASS